MIVLPQKGKMITDPHILLAIVAALSIYSMLVSILILDLSTYIYQQVYFSITDIPKVRRGDYLAIDRFKLKKLNFGQKVNCLYCEYVNGVLAWTKAVANQTEVYSCAVKHKSKRLGQEHQAGYYDYVEFE